MAENFSNLKDRKILFLGAEPLMCQIIETAKEMGLYTIATDYNLDLSLSPGKLVADEYWNISWTDYDELEKACRENQVDGVFSAFSEFKIVATRTLCDRLGLPFYGSMEQIDIIRDKYRFKATCRKYGIPTVDEFELSADLTDSQLNALCYPIVVKPTDSAGSKGISVVYDEKGLYLAVEKALAFSDAKTVIAERYMDCPEVNIIYTIQDGVVSLSNMSESFHCKPDNGKIRLTKGALYPCRFLQAFIDSVDENFQDMIRGIGIRNGSIFFMLFYDNGIFRAFEGNYRIGGGTTYNLIAYNNEINFMKMMLAFSITGEMQGWDVTKYDNPFFKHPCCHLSLVSKPGKIGHVGNMKKVRQLPGVLSLDQFYQVGCIIPDDGTLRQSFARVNIVADSSAELADRIQEVYRLVDLRDTDGNDMILSRMDKDLVYHYWDETGGAWTFDNIGGGV